MNDEEFNNALNNIENTLPINPHEFLDGENEIPSIPVEVNPVINNAAITEEFLENIQDSGLHFKNPPHRPFG